MSEIVCDKLCKSILLQEVWFSVTIFGQSLLFCPTCMECRYRTSAVTVAITTAFRSLTRFSNVCGVV